MADLGISGGKEVGSKLASLLDEFSQLNEAQRRSYHNFVDFDFSELNLYYRDFEYCDLRGAKFSKSYLRMAHFKGALLDKAIFEEAYMEEVDFSGATMRGSILTGSHISNYAMLKGTDLSDAVLLNLIGGHLGRPGVGSVWMTDTNLERADMRGFVFPREFVFRVNLSEANLCGADLSNLDVVGKNIVLKGARFDEKTKFPKQFWPRWHGMRWVGKVSY